MFEIKSISAGWIMGEIGDEKQRHFFDYSYLTDFLEDLMLALLYVHGDWEFIRSRNKFRTELEPAVEDWTVSLEENTLMINIKTYQNEDSHVINDEIDLKMDFGEFLADFVSEMERILESYGLVGYRENWNYEFPVSLYLMLKDISKGQNELAISRLKAEEHFGTEAMTSDLDKEINLLKG